nr:MAG TPA: tail tape measure [Caudoviricetes sp.]
MAASGVGQFSINVKSNLKDFYGELNKSYKTMKELTDKKHALQIDSAQLDKLRDKSQRIAAEMKELRQQKNEIKLGMKEVENVDQELGKIDKKIASLNRQKLEVDAEIQPIRTANVEIHKIDQEIDRINSKKIDFKVSDSLKGIGNTMNNLGDTILSKFNPLTSKLNQMFGFGLITRGIDTVSGMITGSLDSALNRVDTLNNATNTFKNMKFDDASINKVFGKGGTLSSAIDGLPTTLNDATSNVQLLASTTKDLDLSRDIFKAVNDGVLSFGGNADNVNSIVTQLTKSFASGKIQGEVFNSMLDGKMGPVLVEISKRMGYTMEELQKGLSDGKISVKEFQDALIDVDINGSDSLSSLENSVKDATKGLKTSIANMKTAVGRGVANIIESLDKVLNDAGFGGFSGVFGKIGSTIEEGLGLIGSSLEKNKDKISQFIETIIEKFNLAVQIIKKFDFGAFFSGLGKGLKGLKDDGAAVIKILKPLFDLISKGLGNKNTPEMLGKLIPRIFELGVALKVLGGVTKGLGAVTGCFGKFGNLKLPNFGFGSKAQTITAPTINTGAFKSFAKGLATVYALTKIIKSGAEALREVDKVKLGNHLPKKLFNIAAAVTAMGGFAGAAGLLVSNPAVAVVLGTGAATIVGLSKTLVSSSKAMQELDKVKVKGDYSNKIKAIGNALSELSSVTGGILKNNGFTVIGNFGAKINTMLKGSTLKSFGKIAEYLNEIDGMPEIDDENIRTKLRSIKSSLQVLDEGEVTFPGLNGIVSFFNSIHGVYEAIKDKANSSSLKSFAGMLKSLEALDGEVKIDTEKVKKNIGAIKKALKAIDDSENKDLANLDFKTSLLDKAFKALAPWIDAFKEKGNAAKLKALNEVLKQFNDMSELEVSPKKIKKNFDNLKEAITAINGAGIGSIKLVTNDKNITNADKGIAALKNIMENINSLASHIDIEPIKTNMRLLSEALQLLHNDKFKVDSKNMMSAKGFKGLTTRVTALKGIMENINSLSGHVEAEAIKVNIGILSDVFRLLEKDSFRKNNENMMSTDGFKGLKSRITSLKSVMENINSLAGHIQVEDILVNIEILRQIFANLSDISGLFDNVAKMSESIETATNGVAKLPELANALSGIYINADSQQILAAIEEMRQILVNLNSISGAFDGLADMKESIGNSADAILKISEISNSISGLVINADSQQILEAVEEIRQIFVNLSSISGSVEKVANMLNQLTTAKKSIDSLVGIAGSLNSLQGVTLNYDSDENGIYHKIETVRRALVQINDLPAPEGLEQIKALVQEFKNLVDTLNGLSGLFKPVGEGYGKKVIEGFKSVDFEGPAVAKIRKLLSKIISMKYQFREAGKQAGVAFSEGLASRLSDIDLTGLGDKIKNTINSALDEKYSTKIDVELNTTETKTTKKKSNSSSTTKASGGLVAVKAPQAVLTDSPEKPLLNNGEYVIPKKIVSALGMPFLEKLRSGQVSRTFSGLAQSVSHTTSSVVNNVYNTNSNNNTQHMNVYTQGHEDIVLKANRRFRGA